MIPLKSTCLAAADYDPTAGVLYLKFRRRSRIYPYHGVPPSIFQGLISATSKGRYYRRHIRGRYR